MKMPLSLEDVKRQPWWNPEMHSDNEYIEAIKRLVAHKATDVPRGYRNNNPGNLRQKDGVWRGRCSVQKDPVYWQFRSLMWGFRAMLKCLLGLYDGEMKLRRLYDILCQWVPPNKQITPLQYAMKVGLLVGRTPREALPHPKGDKILWVDIILAMAEVENGTKNYYPRGHLRACANDAWNELFGPL